MQKKQKKLQKLFTEIKLYNGKVDGKYNSIKDELIKYQIQENIISSKNDQAAGYFGKKTFASLQGKYG